MCRGASCNDEGYVVVLLMRAELLNLVDSGREDFGRWAMRVLLKCVDETALAELFFRLVEGFGDAIGVESEDVAGRELAVDGG